MISTRSFVEKTDNKFVANIETFAPFLCYTVYLDGWLVNKLIVSTQVIHL